jgi:hypothetical protein
MPLTDLAVRNAKLSDKSFKLSDGFGLYLLITKTGKYWRMNYRFAGKQKTLAFGTYPEVSLSNARDRVSEARKQLLNDIDPSLVKAVKKLSKLEAAENTFQAVANEWYAKKIATWAPTTAAKVKRYLEKDVFPILGKRPIKDINSRTKFVFQIINRRIRSGFLLLRLLH